MVNFSITTFVGVAVVVDFCSCGQTWQERCHIPSAHRAFLWACGASSIAPVVMGFLSVLSMALGAAHCATSKILLMVRVFVLAWILGLTKTGEKTHEQTKTLLGERRIAYTWTMHVWVLVSNELILIFIKSLRSSFTHVFGQGRQSIFTIRMETRFSPRH